MSHELFILKASPPIVSCTSFADCGRKSFHSISSHDSTILSPTARSLPLSSCWSRRPGSTRRID
jgi:hypothetical protein